jgi:hypothetical protein
LLNLAFEPCISHFMCPTFTASARRGRKGGFAAALP